MCSSSSWHIATACSYPLWKRWLVWVRKTFVVLLHYLQDKLHLLYIFCHECIVVLHQGNSMFSSATDYTKFFDNSFSLQVSFTGCPCLRICRQETVWNRKNTEVPGIVHDEFVQLWFWSGPQKCDSVGISFLGDRVLGPWLFFWPTSTLWSKKATAISSSLRYHNNCPLIFFLLYREMLVIQMRRGVSAASNHWQVHQSAEDKGTMNWCRLLHQRQRTRPDHKFHDLSSLKIYIFRV